MVLINEQYLNDPTYGIRRMTAYLSKKGYEINRKREKRLIRKMEIKAVYQEPKTSILPKEIPSTENLVNRLKIECAKIDAYSKNVLSIL
ncbi:IS3 family transposase [Desulfurobacterium atlanticum]|uniref:HTH-like domain-containing protein n=1 Tax=Desulfurobacterium atlanticum TaxID=240169 RepID=A0A238Y6E7_9BACT|nr:IS3 family transposase [Desulfurobacterium atlanticum]SNR66542.1 HTH-like domain-containing protein [Desulfurobacterium atlanticum]